MDGKKQGDAFQQNQKLYVEKMNKIYMQSAEIQKLSQTIFEKLKTLINKLTEDLTLEDIKKASELSQMFIAMDKYLFLYSSCQTETESENHTLMVY